MARKRKKRRKEEKLGVPGWMVSFGDMMTLILTFFILLVSLSHERQAGLVAAGLGSFAIRVQSFGLDNVLADKKKNEIFNEYRRRFNLPPEADPERREEHTEAADEELLRAELARSMRPHDELNQPAVAAFAPGSAELDVPARAYLERLSQTLRPAREQVLVLEGHAPETVGARPGGRLRLATERAATVRTYLVDELGFETERVEARTWLREMPATATNVVDARLLSPSVGAEDQP